MLCARLRVMPQVGHDPPRTAAKPTCERDARAYGRGPRIYLHRQPLCGWPHREIFLINHKSNSAADTAARDAAIAFSFAVQHGADPEAIRLALCRDSHGRASGPLGAALDFLAE
jgi:hypothetical protein